MTAVEEAPLPPTPEELLLDWDRDRPRTHQRELGMSAIGGCRRLAGFIEAGEAPTDPGGSIQAVLGTAIHLPLAEQARKIAGPLDLVEHEVRFAGLLGHLDWLRVVDPVRLIADVVDWKSVSNPRYSQAADDGPDLNQLFQTVLYAAAAARMGYRIRWIILDYVARDSGKLHRHVRPFEIEELQAALRWLDNVRTAELVGLPRDYRPGSAWCDGCQYRTACWDAVAVKGRSPLTALYVEDPDAERWLDQLEEGKQLKSRGTKLYDDARGALDALRPNDRGKSAPVVVDGPDGGRKALHWTVYEEERLDGKAVRKDYERAGAKPPINVNEVVKLTLVPRPKPTEETEVSEE